MRGTDLLRYSIALTFLYYGLDKLFTYTNFVTTTAQDYTATFVPMFLIYTFLYLLPFLETLIGAWILSGQHQHYALNAAGIVMLALAFGNLLAGNAGTVAHNLIYITVIALALIHDA